MQQLEQERLKQEHTKQERITDHANLAGSANKRAACAILVAAVEDSAINPNEVQSKALML